MLKITSKQLYLYSLCTYILCLPLGALKLGTFGTIAKYVAVIPVLVPFMTLKKVYISKPVKAFFIYIFLSGISIVWSVDYDASIGRIITYIEFFLLILSTGFYKYTSDDINKVKTCLRLSSVFTAIIMLTMADYIQGRLWLDGVISEDPNYICAYLFFGIIFSIQTIEKSKSVFLKIVSIIEIMIYLFVIFSTGSRGGVLSTILCVSVYMYILLFHSKVGFFKKVIIIFGIIIIVFLILSELSDILLTRFSLENIKDSGGTGRFEIWTNGLTIYNDSSIFRFIFGYGAAAISNVYYIHEYTATVMHNLYLENLLELGIVGFFVYIYYIFSYIKVALKEKDKFSLCVLIGMLSMAMSVSIYTFKPYLNIMIYIAICNMKME